MAQVNSVLARAAKEIGYNRFSDPEQGTKYGRWYAEKTRTPWFGTNGVPYCAMFVSYILSECGVELSGFPTASCLTALAGAKASGQLLSNVRDARPGDLVLFDWNPSAGDGVDHIGIVERNAGDYIQTIEGNTSAGSAGSQSNGGGVYRRARSWSVVAAIIRPNYDGVQTTTATHTPAPVASGITVDGWWGRATTEALQRYFGLVVDGEIWHQWAPNRPRLIGCTGGWCYDRTGKGSPAIAALQRTLGTDADGIMGVDTINAIISRYGNGICDGRLDAQSPAICGLQRALNAGRL